MSGRGRKVRERPSKESITEAPLSEGSSRSTPRSAMAECARDDLRRGASGGKKHTNDAQYDGFGFGEDAANLGAVVRASNNAKDMT